MTVGKTPGKKLGGKTFARETIGWYHEQGVHHDMAVNYRFWEKFARVWSFLVIP